jgi:hypothetical protein
VSINLNRNSLPVEQGRQQVQQWWRMAEAEIRRARRSRFIWSGAGYSLAIPITGTLPAAGISIAEYWPNWLSGTLVCGFGVSFGLLHRLKVVSRYKLADRTIFLFQGWIEDLRMASFDLSDNRLTRPQVQAILERLYDRLQKIRTEIRELRDRVGLTPPDSEFN